MHTTPFAPANGVIELRGFVSYNDLRAQEPLPYALAVISRDTSLELYDYEETETAPDVGDGAYIKPTSVLVTDAGRWVRKVIFGTPEGGGPGGESDHGELDGLTDDDHPQYILVAGTRAFTGNQSMGNNKLTDLAAPADPNDAVRLTDLTAAITTLTAYIDTEITGAISDHEAAGDPHPQYTTEAEVEAIVVAQISSSRSVMICLTD